MSDKVIPLEELGKRGTLTLYNQAYVEELKAQIADFEKENAELREELKKWKNKWQEQVQKENDESYARTLQTIQLNKAKDHIKKLLGCLRQDTNDPETNYYVCKYMTEAEQFLKENE